MTLQTEKTSTAEALISEANGHRSRENVTVVSGQNLKACQIVGKVTASAKYAAYDNAASDGSEVAAGMLLEAVDASAADKAGAIIARDAEVDADLLNWGTNNAAGITAGKTDLASLNIRVR